MKTTARPKVAIIVVALLALSIINTLFLSAFAQGTAFTYQGQLQSNGGPADGTYNLAFSLFNTNTGGTPIAGPVTNNAVSVTNGLFTVLVDFGPGVFTGEICWLQVGVETNSGSSGFATLTPRQQMTPTPYAIDAENATMLASGAAIGAGSGNSISTNGAVYSFIGGGLDNTIQAGDNDAVISGGAYNTNSGGYATVGGGVLNNARGGAATVSGGQGNTASAIYATVGGGINNTAGGSASFVGGGGFDGGTYSGNSAAGNASVVGGGLGNTIQANSTYATIGGGSGNGIQTGATQSTIAGGAGNSIQLNATDSTIGGGTVNGIQTNAYQSTIAGGNLNVIQTNAYQSTIGGGDQNVIPIFANDSTIGGGDHNTAGGKGATVGGGEFNAAIGADATVCGGYSNNASLYSTVGGGNFNNANGENATIGGGQFNNVSGNWAMIPGGYNNEASGDDSFAAGQKAYATNDGAFVWSDVSGFPTYSPAPNSVTFRAIGGYQLFTGATVGASLAPGTTAWATICDRNAKKNFAPVDGEAVLAKLAQVPVQRWNYKWEPDDSVPHIGPMAQDFKQAFYPGRDDKSITTLEFDGVELAAIQGLNQKLNEKDAEIQNLEKKLDELQATVKQLAEKK